MKAIPSLTGSLLLALLFLCLSRAAAAPKAFDPSPQKTDLMRKAVQRINLAIEHKLSEKGQRYNEPLNDYLFVRRIYVDLTGSIPTYEQVNAFVRSRNPYKRTLLINQLLGSEGYVSHLYNYLADMLRIQTRIPGSNLRSDPFIAWLKNSLHQDKPYNLLVYEMISASGRLHENPAVGYHLRDADMKLDHVAFMSKIFLAKDIACAQCHDHPFEDWTQMDYYSLAAFLGELETKGKPGSYKEDEKDMKRDPDSYVRVKKIMTDFLESRNFEQLLAYKKEIKEKDELEKKAEELRSAYKRLMSDHSSHVHDKRGSVMKLPDDYQYDDAEAGDEVKPRVLIGENPNFPKGLTGREQLARWIASPNNRWFSIAIANRMWARYFGRGVAEPLHDIDLDNSPNPVLLKSISETMSALQYDLRAFTWVLTHTNAYNRLATRQLVTAKTKYLFPGPTLRRMSAEQVWDSFVTLLVENPLRYRAAGGLTLQDVTSADSALAFAESLTKGSGRGKKRSRGQFALLDSQTGEMVLQGDKAMNGKEPESGDPAANPQRVTTGSGREKLILARASELEQPTPLGHFLRKFGQSERTFVANPSNLAGSVPQVMELMNGFATEALTHPDSLIFRKMKGERMASKRADIVFLSILNRVPTPGERSLLLKTLRDASDEDMADLIWALLNTPEFFFIK